MAKHREHREAEIDQDKCPECGGELDTGWECNDCGFDARPEKVFSNCNVCGTLLRGHLEFGQGMCSKCSEE